MTHTIFVGVQSDDEIFMAREASRIFGEQPDNIIDIDGPNTGYTFWPEGFKDEEEIEEADDTT